jgi:ubiquinone/menaquinone biosynthesis C-methylase UbiE
MRAKGFFAAAALAAALAAIFLNGDLLAGFSEQNSLGPMAMQAAISAACLSGAYKGMIQKEGEENEDEAPIQGAGKVAEEDYEKGSIYALLYAAYRHAGVVEDTYKRPYRFTFNTWGISGTEDGKPYGPEYPQRHGMTAYHSLATMPAVEEYIKRKPNAHILEVGCGTGAGADLISRMIHPTTRYTAVDMQKAAIELCVQLHAAHDNPHLSCVHANGKVLPVADRSVDIVLVSETHIAEKHIGAEEKAIFAEMSRVLIPGGLFVWGNALPTETWHDAEKYLQANGFADCGIANHTARAVVARDEDKARVESFLDQLWDKYPVFGIPQVGPGCRSTLDTVVKNFYRHPGTDLYQRMVVGIDSYMNMCHKFRGD